MTTQTKHTPLEWIAIGSPDDYHMDGTAEIRSEHATIAHIFGTIDGSPKANATFIVKAVNSHYALVEACRAACEAASNCLPPSGKGELDAGYYKAKLLAIDKAAAKCSQALALAEKGEQ